ncbi:hypothetical protein DDB_G0279655 [Dictyostelium discoideum AX4]|uniref:Probable serine/threonine-protein phosphatase 2A activator 2 n=1 Tax=Dictyostelium discoideum TaxID=44689 RepID=PTPA2_DICDI|nr:hypothetical protein DDB_G0279655 [Dictyostelium discoideum AX4]Q54WH6.1 RecName: Full=Probable serine/threonine-protein phosphatase 2A activator 2; AltName: Full=Peptidyl-prolyl cis-trans isomerase PTPA-2; Short=PPIase PTPA-2; Short=Rotamase PTPA-2; AltName: Full=Phosphotyrosyl phosphatase activator 2 [Dictyostelium discoideum]EAL67602.1 hypothetical protein DDB_G0279655 [Dictyostelium discoideum AX4]|eukprot:XP_641577.1 hypothetical protein DDB_G0279655 [Dictyostelium discoideum AX4]
MSENNNKIPSFGLKSNVNSTYNHLETVAKLSIDEKLVNEPPKFVDIKTITPLNVENNGIAQKRIISKRDLRSFHTSSTYSELLNFIIQLSLDIQGKSLKSNFTITKNINSIIVLLNQLDQYITDIPPKQIRTRFGNESFVEWFNKVEKETPKLLFNLINDNPLNTPITNEVPIIYNEISTYLQNSWGDKQRIDYGSGHELNFICFLLCLVKIKFIKREEYELLVLIIFNKYLNMMRRLQESYWLEPAGSHGVWGLDDYHFLPFLFGSSQLIEHKYIRPKSIRNDEIVNSSFSDEYMYLGCIRFIGKVKSGGSLLEHSPMLVDISGVKNWSKVNEGMIKMFKSEVLGKLPIMQHMFFASIIQYIDNPDIIETDEEINQRKPIVTHSFSSCGCINRVPSMFAVANTDKILASTSTTTNNNNNNITSGDHCNDNEQQCSETHNHDHNHNHNHNHNHPPPPPQQQRSYFPLD